MRRSRSQSNKHSKEDLKIALKSTLGFGMMRLPVKNGDPTDFDYETLNKMVDEYLAAGYNYFDTSYAYHNGESEIELATK